MSRTDTRQLVRFISWGLGSHWGTVCRSMRTTAAWCVSWYGSLEPCTAGQHNRLPIGVTVLILSDRTIVRIHRSRLVNSLHWLLSGSITNESAGPVSPTDLWESC